MDENSKLVKKTFSLVTIGGVGLTDESWLKPSINWSGRRLNSYRIDRGYT